MSQDIKITVITVAFNAREALERTIQSVIRQDYSALEYIIIDGGSQDGSLELIKQYSPQLAHWTSEPDRGIYDAMNKGIACAQGEYCIFMNAGDTFTDEHVVSRVFSELHPAADVIYGDILKNGRLKISLSPRNCHKMFYCHQSVFTRTDSLRRFPFDITHRYSADFKQAKQMFLSGLTFLHVPVAVANFDTHGVSNTQRSRALWDNVRVVCEVDKWTERVRLLPHLLFPWIVCKLRGK